MDKFADINFDDLSPDERAEIAVELQEQIRVYFRHVVGLVGAYEHIDDKGFGKPQKPFYYSAAVLEIGDQWYLATAGHNLEKMDAVANRPDMALVACGLDDTFTPSAADQSPITYFDYVNARRFHRNISDIDFGLIHLRRNYRDLLSANGIQPLSQRHWNPQAVNDSSTFLMVGFPEDSIDSSISYGVTHYNTRVKGRGSVILIDRLIEPPDDIADSQHGRFIGQIRPEHDVGSIVGMSGGPIFCFKGCSFEPYYLAAIQSTWLPKRKLTFGCPIPLILAVAGDFLASVPAT